MVRKINVKFILEFPKDGLSRNMIVQTWHMSQNDVYDVIHISDECDIFYDDVIFIL